MRKIKLTPYSVEELTLRLVTTKQENTLILLSITDLEDDPVIVYVTDGMKKYGYTLNEFSNSKMMEKMNHEDRKTIKASEYCANFIFEMKVTGKVVLPSGAIITN